MRKLRHIVPAFGRPHRELLGNRPVPSVKGQRLLRRQAPVLAETRFEVNGGKTPERGVPSRALAFHLVRPARDIPALDDFLQETVLEQPLPVSPRYVACANGCSPVGVLKPVQDFEGFRQFFRRGSHVCPKLVLCVARQLVCYVVP
jgi:hypothetical protein